MRTVTSRSWKWHCFALLVLLAGSALSSVAATRPVSTRRYSEFGENVPETSWRLATWSTEINGIPVDGEVLCPGQGVNEFNSCDSGVDFLYKIGTAPPNLVWIFSGFIGHNMFDGGFSVALCGGNISVLCTDLDEAGVANLGIEFTYVNGSLCVMVPNIPAGGLALSISASQLSDRSPRMPSLNLGGAILTPQTLKFASQAVGTESESQTLTLTNPFASPLPISAISSPLVYPQTNNCPEILGGGESCTLHVKYAPQNTDTVHGTLTIADGSGIGVETVSVQGAGNSSGLVFMPPAVNFGSGATESLPQLVMMLNTGTSAINVASIDFEVDDYTGNIEFFLNASSTCIDATIAQGEFCSLLVSFSPVDSGSLSGAILVTDASAETFRVPLSGTGLGGPPLNPLAMLNFPLPFDGSPPKAPPITLTNIGPNLEIIDINASGGFDESNNCLAMSPLPNLGICTIYARFRPTSAVERHTGSVTVATPIGMQIISLTGGGAGGLHASISPPELNFGERLVATTGDPQVVTFTNQSPAPLTIADVSLTGADEGDFQLDSICPIAPATLDPLLSCPLLVSFTPTAGGPRKAVIALASNADVVPPVFLRGRGLALSVLPLSISFPSQAVGSTSSASVVTLQNIGSAPLTIGGAAITGSNPSDFGLTNNCPVPPLLLAGSSNCTLSVTFRPTATGPRKAQLLISNDGGKSPGVVTLTGSGFSPPSAPAQTTPTSDALSTATTRRPVAIPGRGAADRSSKSARWPRGKLPNDSPRHVVR